MPVFFFKIQSSHRLGSEAKMAAPNSTHGSPKTFEVSCVTISSEIESIL